MTDVLLVLNAGSSSLRFSLFAVGAGDTLTEQLGGNIEELYQDARFRAKDGSGKVIGEHAWPSGAAPGHTGALDYLLPWITATLDGATLAAVGHRVVHGGAAFAAPVRVDDAVMKQLEALVPLAPLHQPHNLLPIRELARRSPALPQVACFDTAFHHDAPPLSQAFALPASITERGVRRYGFHGLSYEYIASVLPAVDARAAAGRTVVLHLGNGASMCALNNGRSIASTMSFTALDGIPMGTRCGALDPGVVLYLMDELKMDARAIEKLLYRESGLLGVSGISSDMRTLEAHPDPRARDAIALFVYRIGRELGSLAAALGGLDAIVFTAGIGENSAPVRAGVCASAAWLGVEPDAAANADTNAGGAGARRISAAGSRTSAWVIPTNEALTIARHTRAVMAA
jgi:acetate kinase